MKNVILGNMIFEENQCTVVSVSDIIKDDGSTDYAKDGLDYIILDEYEGELLFKKESTQIKLAKLLFIKTWLGIDEIAGITGLSTDRVNEIDLNTNIKRIIHNLIK